MSGVRTYETKLTIWIMEDFWLIVTPRRVKMRQKSSAPPIRSLGEAARNAAIAMAAIINLQGLKVFRLLPFLRAWAIFNAP